MAGGYPKSLHPTPRIDSLIRFRYCLSEALVATFRSTDHLFQVALLDHSVMQQTADERLRQARLNRRHQSNPPSSQLRGGHRRREHQARQQTFRLRVLLHHGGVISWRIQSGPIAPGRCSDAYLIIQRPGSRDTNGHALGKAIRLIPRNGTDYSVSLSEASWRRASNFSCGIEGADTPNLGARFCNS